MHNPVLCQNLWQDWSLCTSPGCLKIPYNSSHLMYDTCISPESILLNCWCQIFTYRNCFCMADAEQIQSSASCELEKVLPCEGTQLWEDSLRKRPLLLHIKLKFLLKTWPTKRKNAMYKQSSYVGSSVWYCEC
jgi:hypothetical protein